MFFIGGSLSYGFLCVRRATRRMYTATSGTLPKASEWWCKNTPVLAVDDFSSFVLNL